MPNCSHVNVTRGGNGTSVDEHCLDCGATRFWTITKGTWHPMKCIHCGDDVYLTRQPGRVVVRDFVGLTDNSNWRCRVGNGRQPHEVMELPPTVPLSPPKPLPQIAKELDHVLKVTDG